MFRTLFVLSVCCVLVAAQIRATTFLSEKQGIPAPPPAPSYQPDVLLRSSAETQYFGDNVYDTTGATQVKTQSVAPDHTAVYYCRLQNDGNTADSFTVTGPSGNNGWAIGYVNYATNAVITGPVTGGGWNTGVILPGQYVVVMVRVVPSVAAAGTTRTLVLTASSIGTATRQDAVKAVTTAYRCQPDLQIRTGAETEYLGDDIYNTTGAGQTKALCVTADQTGAFYCRIQNDGNTPDSFTITGPAGSGGWTIGYVDYATNTVITNQVTGAGWHTGVIPPGQRMVVFVRIVPSSPVPAGTMKEVWLRAVSTLNTTQPDLVKMQIRVYVPNQPDLLIRTGAETGYIGDNVYNATGTGQMKAQSVTTGQTAMCYCRIQNDGHVPESFIVTGPASGNGWLIGYVDYATNTVITGQVTGAGWNTGLLQPGQYLVVLLRVVPSSSMPAGTKEVWLRAVSTQNIAHLDLVRMQTRVYIPNQPDLQIRTGAETVYSGDNLYNATGVGQTKAQGVIAGQTGVYYCRIQNDGNTSVSFTVTGPTGSGGWAMGYVDYGTNTVITDQVTGAGWNTGVISPGQRAVVFVRVAPSSTTPAGATKETWLRAVSNSDATRLDLVKMQTRVYVPNQPDLLIRTGAETGYLGDNIYNTTGTGQTRTQSVTAGQTAVCYCRIQNDGHVPESFTVTGPASGEGWTIGYVNFAANTIITSQVVGAGWNTGVIQPGQNVVVLLRVVPSNTMAAGTKEVWLRAASTQNAARLDLAKMQTRVYIANQPDLQIRTGAETEYLGDNIYNATGAGQTRALSVAVGQTAAYYCRIQNDGNTPDSFTITGPAGSSGWAIGYIDYITNTVITDQVNGTDGWNTGVLLPGQRAVVLVRMVPASTVSGGALYNGWLSAASVTNPARLDVVEMHTSVQSAVP